MERMTIEHVLLYILLVHYIADFGMQTNWQARNKSHDVVALTYHVLVYSLIWFVAILCIGVGFKYAFLFMFITFIAHYITDFCTSRLGAPFWEEKDFHNGFKVVGFDQCLHYIQLYFTFKLIEVI